MIASIGGQMGVKYEPNALDMFTKIGGGHPFLTRQLCSFAIRDQERPIVVDRKRASWAVNQYLREAWSYLSELWAIDHGGPPAEESALLTELAVVHSQEENRLISLDFAPEKRRALELARDRLRDRYLIRSIEGKWEITIPLYRYWIQHYIISRSYEEIAQEY